MDFTPVKREHVEKALAGPEAVVSTARRRTLGCPVARHAQILNRQVQDFSELGCIGNGLTSAGNLSVCLRLM